MGEDWYAGIHTGRGSPGELGGQPEGRVQGLGVKKRHEETYCICIQYNPTGARKKPVSRLEQCYLQFNQKQEIKVKERSLARPRKFWMVNRFAAHQRMQGAFLEGWRGILWLMTTLVTKRCLPPKPAEQVGRLTAYSRYRGNANYQIQYQLPKDCFAIRQLVP